MFMIGFPALNPFENQVRAGRLRIFHEICIQNRVDRMMRRLVFLIGQYRAERLAGLDSVADPLMKNHANGVVDRRIGPGSPRAEQHRGMTDRSSFERLNEPGTGRGHVDPMPGLGQSSRVVNHPRIAALRLDHPAQAVER
jgi:hypothetical protein